MVIFAFASVTVNFVYFGLLWGAGDISGSLHLNSAINGLMALFGSQFFCKISLKNKPNPNLAYPNFRSSFKIGLFKDDFE